MHIDVLSKKLKQKIDVLRRLSSLMPGAALLKIFNTIIFPYFNYCCTVWGTSMNKSYIDRLFELQKRAARIVLYTCETVYYSKCWYVFIFEMDTYKWLFYLQETYILTFNVLHNMTPDYLNVFKFVHQVSTRTSRQSASNLLFIPRVRTEYYKGS